MVACSLVGVRDMNIHILSKRIVLHFGPITEAPLDLPKQGPEVTHFAILRDALTGKAWDENKPKTRLEWDRFVEALKKERKEAP
jgi:hypothetical protein